MSGANPNGTHFYDGASGRHMILVNETGHTYDGWLCFRHPDGGWVTLRKATEADLAAIRTAVSGLIETKAEERALRVAEAASEVRG